MPRPVPPQVIPRPPGWRPGGPAPWAGVPQAHRTGIGIDRVLDALAALAQRGPVPEDVGADRLFGPAGLAGEGSGPPLLRVNAAVLAALFEEAGEARVILTRRRPRVCGRTGARSASPAAGSTRGRTRLLPRCARRTRRSPSTRPW